MCIRDSASSDADFGTGTNSAYLGGATSSAEALRGVGLPSAEPLRGVGLMISPRAERRPLCGTPKLCGVLVRLATMRARSACTCPRAESWGSGDRMQSTTDMCARFVHVDGSALMVEGGARPRMHAATT